MSDGFGLNTVNIRARIGFGPAPSSNPVTLPQFREILLFLAFPPFFAYRKSSKAIMGTDGQGQTWIDLCHLFEGQNSTDKVEPQSPEFFWDKCSEKSELSNFAPTIPREAFAHLRIESKRGDLLP